MNRISWIPFVGLLVVIALFSWAASSGLDRYEFSQSYDWCYDNHERIGIQWHECMEARGHTVWKEE
jgi:hypothetical protein